MDTVNTYKKMSEPKVVDAINVNGKYVDSSALKSKLVTASCASAFILAFAAFVLLLLT